VLSRYRPGPFLPITRDRINRLPTWAREYLHHVASFDGAEEVKEIFFLRDQNKALIRLVAELNTENRQLRRQLTRRKEQPTKMCWFSVKWREGVPH
jgi:hypothetical protein